MNTQFILSIILINYSAILKMQFRSNNQELYCILCSLKINKRNYYKNSIVSYNRNK